MYNTEDRYFEIVLSTVNKIFNELEYCKDFILYLSVVNSAEGYTKIYSPEIGNMVEDELTFSNYMFRAHYENSINTVDYDCIYYVFRVTFFITYILRTFYAFWEN